MLNNILKGVYYFEHAFDKVRWTYLRKYNKIGQLIIMPYRGFGNANKAIITGRLIEDRGIRDASKNDTIWQNLKAMYKRFESNEIPGANIEAIFFGQKFYTKTDEEGYFTFQFPITEPLSDEQLWHKVSISLADKIGKNKEPVKATGHIMIPSKKANYGIISDIDDTVLRTEATSFIKMMKKTFLFNAQTRLPFEGVAAFYRALHDGTENEEIKNPLFYVSSSPWNLYDMLEEFFEIQQIPAGPFMLRDLGLSKDTLFQSKHQTHKLEQINTIFNYEPELPFILIGDSGQHDPEIYEEVIKLHPGRVKAIYIRDVSHGLRSNEVIKIIERINGEKVEMLLVKDTEAAASHAIKQGFIKPGYMGQVKQEKTLPEAT